MRSVTSCFNSTSTAKTSAASGPSGPVLGDLAVCPAPQSAHHDPAGAELGSGGPYAQPGLFFPGLGGLLPELGHGAGRHLWPAGRYGGVQLSGCQPLRLHDARPAPPAGGPVSTQYLAGLSFLLLPQLAVFALTRRHGGGPGVSGLWPLVQWLLARAGCASFLLLRRCSAPCLPATSWPCPPFTAS